MSWRYDLLSHISAALNQVRCNMTRTVLLATFSSFFAKCLNPRPLPPRLSLERLESRDLWAVYVWTGGAGTNNPGWSFPANWAIGGNVATQMPATQDEVVFDGTGRREQTMNFGLPPLTRISAEQFRSSRSTPPTQRRSR